LRYSATLTLFAAVLLLSTSSVAATVFSNETLSIRAYSDGATFVTQRLAVGSNATTIEVPLLSSVLSGVVATDQNGSPLSFKISGSNITVYTLGATAVTLQYGTTNLTGKAGTVWTLAFTTYYNSTVILPANSTLLQVSGTPYSIGLENGSPVATIGPGTWRMSYGVSIGPIGSRGTNSTTTSSGGGLGGLFQAGDWRTPALVLAAVLVLAGVLLFRWWKRRVDTGELASELRPDDVAVLNFIQEKGGKVLEPEIRTRFALPKTSAWRQVKRLERMGYVRVTRIGSQNQIEYLKKKEA
jgi:uncharacterized membrane protein